MATQQVQSMISETSICNVALGFLGQTPITSIDDPANDKAELMRNIYPFLRDAVMQEYTWSFSLSRSTNTTGDMDEWGQYYKHAVPLENLQIVRVFKDPETRQVAHWELEGNHILADSASIYIQYQTRVTDTGKFSELFVQALAARIAADAAIHLTQDYTLQTRLWALYGDKIKSAVTRDGMQGRNQTLRTPDSILTRAGGGYSMIGPRV